MKQYQPEFKTTYQVTRNETLYTVTSECPTDTTDDILDALAKLMMRDVAGIKTERK